jgi:hypothetical protein
MLFQTIIILLFRTFAWSLCFDMQHIGISTRVRSSSNLKVACAVRPPLRSIAAMPEEATAKAMLRVLLTFAKTK